MRKYTQKELRQLVRLGVAEDYTNKPSEYAQTLNRLEKVGYSVGVYGLNGGVSARPGNGYIVRHYWTLYKFIYSVLTRCGGYK